MKSKPKHNTGKREITPEKGCGAEGAPATDDAAASGDTIPETSPAEVDAAPAPAGAKNAPPLDERYLRLQADFDNFRRRTLREKEDLYRRANEDLMENLLPVLDHLDLAFSSAGKDNAPDAVVQGFELVAQQLRSVLIKSGLSSIATEGVAFDPNVHEAILQMPSGEVAENGVISCARTGYMLGGRLLRAAQVVVSCGPDGSGEATMDQDPGNVG